MRAVIVLLMLAMSAGAAQLPPPPPPPPPMAGQAPRDVVRPSDPKGTGVIRGRVVTADTGSPIRRANVSLSPMAPPVSPAVNPAAPMTTTTQTVMIDGVPRTITSSGSLSINMVGRPRNVTTDSQGAFEFTELPAGSYRVFATQGQYSAAYLPMAYGAKKPSGPGASDPGAPIELANGQRFEKATIALPRGAVITGRVTDDGGEPMARVQVYTMFLAQGSSRPARSGGGSQTDDLGQFRLYGLPAGDYLVVAEARGPTFVAPNAPPETDDDKIGFLTTYFPGTADEGAAQRVRARLGGETPGVEIRMVSGRMFRISGTINDSRGRPAVRTSGSLMRSGISGGYSSYGFSTDEQGRFQMRNIPPGNYRLIVRGSPPRPPEAQNEPPEMATMPLSVSADLEGLVIITGPGATITGQVVFEQGPPQASPGQLPPQIRVNAQLADPQTAGPVPMPQTALVSPDFTFTMKGMMGEFLLRTGAPGQYLKAVMVGAEDISDTPREFKNGDRVTLVMTSAASTLEGTVSDAKGTPVAETAIMVFSEDKAAWRPNSLRTRRGFTDSAGHYRVSGVLPGRYYAIAVPRERLSVPSSAQDATFFEQLAKDATTFVIGEGEQRQVDLKLAASGGA